MALDSPYSTSGLPIVALLEAGLEPLPYQTLDAEVNDDEVGYTFSYEDGSTLLWVLNGEVIVGVVDSKTFANLAQEGQDTIWILAETESVPRQIVVVAPNLDPEMVGTLKSALMTMDESDQGQAVLATFEETFQFDNFPKPQTLDRLNELFERASALQESHGYR